MRIEQLQAFLAVVDTGNFGQAARDRGVTQSTISRQIQALETDLGAPLFHRHTQAQLTVAGERCLPRARKICQEWQNLTQDVQELMAGKQSDLCVAAIHSVCSYLLPPILQKFCRTHPQVQLRVTALGSDRALKVLRDGLVDVAVVMNNPAFTASADMVSEILYEEAIEVLMAADHPLSKCYSLTAAEIARYPQITFKDGYGMQRLTQNWFATAGVTPHIAMELNTLDAFRGAIRQGECLALLPQSALTEIPQDPTLVTREIAAVNGQPPLQRQVILATTSDRLYIPPIQAFYELVCSFYSSDSPTATQQPPSHERNIPRIA
jgi:DNA-binding transcriptional LysR family regulator